MLASHASRSNSGGGVGSDRKRVEGTPGRISDVTSPVKHTGLMVGSPTASMRIAW